ncbi:MAG: hypothetical protein E7375_01690 [Clostridiales bacterium]|nr:hypothetical protein [Clostridiales bacterium]
MAEETVSLEQLESLKSKKTKGQNLKTSNLLFDGGDSLVGVSQNIETTKSLKTETDQIFSVVDTGLSTGKYKDSLLIVSSGDKVSAYFEKDGDGLKVKVSEEFIAQFKAANPDMTTFDAGEAKDGFYSFDIERLKLSSSLTIEDIQVKAGGKDFALMFSTLGFQVKDAEGKLGKTTAPSDHFDITVSTKFIEETYDLDSQCTMDKTEPAYSAVLISMIQMERKKATGELTGKTDAETEKKKNEIVSLKLPVGSKTPDVELYSIPIKDGDEIKYLNIKKEGTKTFAYLHITGSATNNRTRQIPRFYEIHSASLEASTTAGGLTKESLFLSIDNKRDKNNDIPLSIDFGFEENKQALTALRNVMPEEFSHISNAYSEPIGSTKTSDGKSLNIYPIPERPNAAIASLDDVAILSRATKTIEREPDPVPVPPDPVPPDPDPKPKPKPKEEEKDKKKTPWGLIALVGFGLITFLSTVFPILSVATIPFMAFCGIMAIVQTKPWKTVKDWINKFKESRKKAKEKESTIKKSLEKEKDLKKKKTKDRKTYLARSIHLEKLKAERERVEADPLLTKQEKEAQLKKLDKEIAKYEKSTAKAKEDMETSKKAYKEIYDKNDEVLRTEYADDYHVEEEIDPDELTEVLDPVEPIAAAEEEEVATKDPKEKDSVAPPGPPAREEADERDLEGEDFVLEEDWLGPPAAPPERTDDGKDLEGEDFTLDEEPPAPPVPESDEKDLEGEDFVLPPAPPEGDHSLDDTPTKAKRGRGKTSKDRTL